MGDVGEVSDELEGILDLEGAPFGLYMHEWFIVIPLMKLHPHSFRFCNRAHG